jgi:hypothetical protein
MTPIIGLFVVHALRQLGESSLDMLTDRSLYIPIPYIFNIPYKPFHTLQDYFKISDCLQWYLFDYPASATPETRAFFGHNRGTPMLRPESEGLINGRSNVLSYACKEANRSVPFFEELDSAAYSSTHDYLKAVIYELHDQAVDYSDRNYPIRYLEKLPDGVFHI